MIALIIVGAFFFLVIKSEKPFSQTPLVEKNTIVNLTGIPYYDTVFHTAMNLIGMTGVEVQVRLLSNAVRDGDLKAHVREAGGIYYVFIDDLGRVESIEVIAHELIHIVQMQTGEFTYKDGAITWQGKNYTLEQLPYERRPWEIDAFNSGESLYEETKKELYK